MLLFLNSSTMPRKTRANKVPSTPSVSLSRVQLFRNDHSHEAYEKLNSKRKIWAEHSVILDRSSTPDCFDWRVFLQPLMSHI